MTNSSHPLQALLKGKCILKSVYKVGLEIGTWLTFSQITDGGWEQQIPAIYPQALDNIPRDVTDPAWILGDFKEFTFNVSLCSCTARRY